MELSKILSCVSKTGKRVNISKASIGKSGRQLKPGILIKERDGSQ